jgi:hypothetical protein
MISAGNMIFSMAGYSAKACLYPRTRSRLVGAAGVPSMTTIFPLPPSVSNRRRVLGKDGDGHLMRRFGVTAEQRH